MLLAGATGRCSERRPQRVASWSAPTSISPSNTMPVNFTGVRAPPSSSTASSPRPRCACARVTRSRFASPIDLRERTSIHWHGIILPADMDGVPGLSFDGIAPGSTFTYRYKVNQSGTYWYHSHSRFQEQIGLLRRADRRAARRRAPRARIASTCCCCPTGQIRIPSTSTPRSSGTATTTTSASAPSAISSQTCARRAGRDAVADRRMWGSMRMNPTDLADVSGYAYTYLLNGVTPAGNWTGDVHAR